MRAWCIEDQQLQLDTLPDPQPGPEEIRVEVKAIGVNRADLLQVLGRYPAPPGTDSRSSQPSSPPASSLPRASTNRRRSHWPSSRAWYAPTRVS